MVDPIDKNDGVPDDKGKIPTPKNPNDSAEIVAGFQKMARDTVDPSGEHERQMQDSFFSKLRQRIDNDPESSTRNTMPAKPLNYALMAQLQENAIQLTDDEVKMLDVEEQGGIQVGYQDITFLKAPDGTLITMFIRRDENQYITVYKAITTRT